MAAAILAIVVATVGRQTAWMSRRLRRHDQHQCECKYRAHGQLRPYLRHFRLPPYLSSQNATRLQIDPHYGFAAGRESYVLRTPVDDAEKAGALARLFEAHGLMTRALEVLDGTAVATDCDAHLDQAMHNLSAAIVDVDAGKPIFTAARGDCVPSRELDTLDERSDFRSPNPWN